MKITVALLTAACLLLSVGCTPNQAVKKDEYIVSADSSVFPFSQDSSSGEVAFEDANIVSISLKAFDTSNGYLRVFFKATNNSAISMPELSLSIDGLDDQENVLCSTTATCESTVEAGKTATVQSYFSADASFSIDEVKSVRVSSYMYRISSPLSKEYNGFDVNLLDGSVGYGEAELYNYNLYGFTDGDNTSRSQVFLISDCAPTPEPTNTPKPTPEPRRNMSGAFWCDYEQFGKAIEEQFATSSLNWELHADTIEADGAQQPIYILTLNGVGVQCAYTFEFNGEKITWAKLLCMDVKNHKEEFVYACRLLITACEPDFQDNADEANKIF